MRVTALGVCAAYLLLTALTSSAAAPATADDPALQNIEALGNREPDRWQGRHHYLYDDDYQPGGQGRVGAVREANPAQEVALRRTSRCT